MQSGAEAVGREAPEVDDGLLQAANRAGGVEGPTARMGSELSGVVEDEVVERLAADEDEVLAGIVAKLGQLGGETTVRP